MAGSFALIHTWPDLRNAEYEVIQRLIGAAANRDRSVAVIDNNGSVIWASADLGLRRGKILPANKVDFAISLHFESPRTLDIYSYYAVWQPIDFYYDFGYHQSIDRMSTHNDLLSCDSDLADAHALNIFAGLGRKPPAPLPQLFHMVAEPYLEPQIGSDAKLFYIGINWERIGRPKGRFHDTLISLDGKGLTSIYGPERILGVAPWEGFKTYEGELPFDGHSVKRAINRAGICLALSSASHKRAGIMSNRLFEGLAGGGAVIATPNRLIEKHFSEVVYLVDDSRGEEVLGQQVLEAVREIRSNIAEARRRVLEGQRILRELCSLEGSIDRLFEGHVRRKAHFERQFLDDAEATVVLVDDCGSVDKIKDRIADYRGQKRATVDLHLICDHAVAARLVDEAAGGAIRTLTIRSCMYDPVATTFDGVRPGPERTGPIVRDVLAASTAPFFMIAGTNEIIFSDHLASLAKAIGGQPDIAMARSGALRETFNGPTSRARSLIELRSTDFAPVANVSGPAHRARHLFKRSLAESLADDLFTLLDGEEHRFFQLAGLLHGPIAQTGYATYVLDEAMAAVPRTPAEPIEYQCQAIRDRVAQDPRWIELQTRLGRADAGTLPVQEPVKPSTHGTSHRPIAFGKMLETVANGAGAEYLGSGFSQPEEGLTWLAADRGSIEFALPAHGIEEEFDVVLLAAGRQSQFTGREQHCTFLINGMSCAYLTVPGELTELRLRIPRNLLVASSIFKIEIVPDHLEPVSPDAGVNDERKLAVALMAFGLMPQAMTPLPVLRPNMMHDTGEAGTGSGALLRGFYEAEPSLTWAAGTSATIRFRLATPVSRPVLRLGFWGRRSAAELPQVASLSLNKRRLPDLVLEDRQDVIDIPLGQLAPIGTQYNLEIRLAHAEIVKDANGKLLDGRLLGLAVTGIGVFGGEVEDAPIQPPAEAPQPELIADEWV